MQKTILLLSVIFFSNFILAQTESNSAASWLNKNCIPIKYVKAENGFDDLNPLKDLIGDARIVSLGECTHGSSEVFSMKHRMLEYLVKEKGFTIFSIEANMPEAYALNEYIIDGKGDPRKLMAGMYFWTWYTQEVLDMIEWMKKYNETATKKIMFTGFDMQFSDVSIKILREYLIVNNNNLLSILNDYDSLYKKKQMKKNESTDNFKKLKADAQILLDSLNAHKPMAYNKDFNWAFQNARILWQYAANHFSNPARDESMAENVKWILDENPSAKIVLWAHNGHIRKDKDGFEYKSMGEYLDKIYGKQMIAIGFATAEGTYTAVQRDGKKFIGLDSANTLLTKEGSYESFFNIAETADFILDLRNISKGQEGTGWIQEKRLFRSIGAVAMNKFQFAKINLISHFDMIIFIRKTSASKCFSIKKLAGN
ncbi:MAG: erythromycin esterase family protein [Chitinophagaceae bacterium]|nr:erythromycin esterase family protein [Chitinophagaceae bacterium]